MPGVSVSTPVLSHRDGCRDDLESFSVGRARPALAFLPFSRVKREKLHEQFWKKKDYLKIWKCLYAGDAVLLHRQRVETTAVDREWTHGGSFLQEKGKGTCRQPVDNSH